MCCARRNSIWLCENKVCLVRFVMIWSNVSNFGKGSVDTGHVGTFLCSYKNFNIFLSKFDPSRTSISLRNKLYWHSDASLHLSHLPSSYFNTNQSSDILQHRPTEDKSVVKTLTCDNPDHKIKLKIRQFQLLQCKVKKQNNTTKVCSPASLNKVTAFYQVKSFSQYTRK